MLENFWDKFGMTRYTSWQKTKWIIATIIFIIPNTIAFGFCRMAEYVEYYYFDHFMPAIHNWITK